MCLTRHDGGTNRREVCQMTYLFALILCLLGTAVNVGMYLWNGSPVSVAAAVFCGGMAVYNGAKAVRE
jgi:hypothetical protein